MDNQRSVLIVTGEASGDLHGGNLVKAMKTLDSSLSFAGMGGEELRGAGVEILFDAARVSVVGVVEVVNRLPDIWQAQKILRRYLKEKKPELLIIIDLPDFNLLLAGYAKKLGIKVFYYITPQVWAWRSGRVKTIRERVDTLGVILPFEEQFFNRHGVDAHYVGHPLLDSVVLHLTSHQFREKYTIEKEQRCVGLLPGSRKREVLSLMPIFLDAAKEVQAKSSERLCFLIPLASTISEEDVYETGLKKYQETLDIRLINGDRYELMASCDCVVAASGTVTLELAILEKPMIVTYRVSPSTYILGRLLIKLEHFSLVNLIAGKEVVPELLQSEVQPQTIATHLQTMLYDDNHRAMLEKGLAEVKARLGSPGASQRAAEVALDVLRNQDLDEENIEECVELQIDGVLDLHSFSPKDLKTLIPEYLDECSKKGIREVRIIHGKGIGNIRRSVHALLERDPRVVHYQLAGEDSGGWGATMVQLMKEDGK